MHFAGGNCFSFQFMRPYLTEFEFIPLELPGRGRRIAERLLTDLDAASKDISDQIRAQLNGDGFLLYGHSMGSVIGLKVAALLEAKDLFPIQLVVSGNPGPGVKKDKVRSAMGDEDFRNELKEIGGMPDEILANKEMFEFFEPILRADFAVAEGADDGLMPLIQAPIYAIMGNREERTEEIHRWGPFTRGAFETKIMEGRHFFIYDHAPAIAATIKNCYQRYVSET